MSSGRDETEREGGVGGIQEEQVVHTIREGFDRAERAGAGGMVHGAAALPILLIINVETDAVGLLELCEWGRVGKDAAIQKETDVLPSELDGTSAGAGGGHGIFAGAKQKEECNSEEVRDGLRHGCALGPIVVHSALDCPDRECQLRFRGRILGFIAFHETGEG